MLLTESIFSNEDELTIKVESLRADLVLKDEKLKHYEQENTWLREQLATLKRAQFGRKSEKWEAPEQMVFNEAEIESQKPDGDKDDGPQKEITVAGHTKKRGHRRPLPDHLPREVIKIELPLEEQIAKDGTRLKVIGWEVSEKLKFEPSKSVVVEIH